MQSVMDPADFFKEIGYAKLCNRGILNGKRKLLNGKTVAPLIILMKQFGVASLQRDGWFLDIEYNFRNPRAKDWQFRYEKHNLREVRKGIVFEGQNKLINPYYRSGQTERIAGNKLNIPAPSGVSSNDRFTYERDNSIFINEVISSPENRINLNIFGLLNIREFQTWFFGKLGLDPDIHIMFPSKNVVSDDNNESGRPDFVIHAMSDGLEKFVAYVEVELGSENQEQLLRYRKLASNGNVISIVGRKHSGGDMSLEEILDAVRAVRPRLREQHRKYLNAFEAMFIEYVLEGASRTSYSVNEVSDVMRSHPLVDALTKRLPISFEITGSMVPGEFRMNTRKENGFSLRVYSSISKVQKSLSVMAISGGHPFVIFPAKVKLEKYLPNRKGTVQQFASVLSRMGYGIEHLDEKKRMRIPLKIVLGEIDVLAPIIYDLGKF